MTDENQLGGEGVVVLREIWNELKSVHASLKGELSRTRTELSGRIDSTNTRLDSTNSRIDEVRDELKLESSVLRRSVVESEIRVATAVTELTGTIHGLRDVVTGWRAEHRADREEFRRRLERMDRPPEPHSP